VIAGVIIAGAVIYTNNFSGSKSASTVVGTTTTALASKYQKFTDLAAEIGLNAEQFGQCMDKFDASEVKSDLSEAGQYGVNGTPAFFIGKSGDGSINGVRISGAYPFETFAGVIDGLNEGNDQKIIDAIGPDQEGNPAPNVAAISQQVSLDDDPVKGDSNAPITIIEFSDYECPFCQRHFNTTYQQLVAEYIDTGKVKFVFRDLPLSFHDPVATQAAVAANCAREQGGDESYFKYHDEYYSRTKANGEGL
jgi:protein-disulfide isomerase